MKAPSMIARLREAGRVAGISGRPCNMYYEAADVMERMQEALVEIRDWRKSCIEYDKDMGHGPRDFDEEDLRIIEACAHAALKGGDA